MTYGLFLRDCLRVIENNRTPPDFPFIGREGQVAPTFADFGPDLSEQLICDWPAGKRLLSGGIQAGTIIGTDEANGPLLIMVGRATRALVD